VAQGKSKLKKGSKAKGEVTAEMVKNLLDGGEADRWGREWANGVWNTGRWTQEEKERAIISIHKKGGRENINNYRGIVLAQVYGKVLEIMIDERVKTIRRHTKSEREDQFAYKKQRDRTTMLIVVLEEIRRKTKSRGVVFVAKADIEKAYDRVRGKFSGQN
jgi:hypothetical protein